ncbi:hypothetical protein GC173_10830 [bacterium]|nr:hypothetical protein [bacterium]
MADFVAIDFETANSKPNSACAIGLTIVSGSDFETHHFLIRPPVMSFSTRNIAIHGITPDRVREEPRFVDLYPRIQAILCMAPLWAHYAPFDGSVLRALGVHYKIAVPCVIHCSCDLARDHLPQLSRHRLPDVCRALGIPLGRHHDAGADSLACARIVHRLTAKA